MRDVAAYLIVFTGVIGLIIGLLTVFTDKDWDFKRSPDSGVCYEFYQNTAPFMHATAMSPVTSTLCDLED